MGCFWSYPEAYMETQTVSIVLIKINSILWIQDIISQRIKMKNE